MRDERLAKIISMFQAYCKGYLMRKEYRKMCDQRYVGHCKLTIMYEVFYDTVINEKCSVVKGYLRLPSLDSIA